MAFDCDYLKILLTGLSLVKDCYRLEDGTLRMATKLRYPNGAFLDVFVHDQGDLLTDGEPSLYKGYVLSDMGQTALYLLDFGMEIWSTDKRKRAVAEVCESLEVEHHRGQLRVRLFSAQESEVADAFLRLSQACLRVADLSYMHRFATPGTFKEEVNEFLADTRLPYESDITLPGKYNNNEVPIDFRVKGPRTSLLRLISGKTTSYAHVTANEVFRCWHDLVGLKEGNRFVTVVDERERTKLMRTDDVARLGELSEVVFFPLQHEQFRALLTAA